MLFDPKIKPRLWNLQTGTVAYNCARMGLPMPVLAMPMWEGAGDKVYDYSGNRNNGDCAGTTLPSWSGGNLQLPVDAYVNCGNNDSVRITGKEITIACCFYSTLYVIGGNRIISKRTSAGGSDVFGLYFGGSTIIRMRLNGTDRSWDTGSNVFNKEFTIYGTADGTNWHLYSDGIEKATGAFSANIADSTSPLCLGTRYLEDRWLKGWIKYAYLWDVALTPGQVRTATNNPFGMFEPIRRPAIWSYVSAGGQSASLADTFSLSETHTPIGKYISSLSDSFDLTGSRTVIGKYNRSLSDGLNLSETTVPIGHFLKSFSDIFNATDVLSALAKLKVSNSDTLNLTDSITVTVNLKGTLSDTLTLTDNLAALLKALAALSDILTLTDSIASSGELSASLSDTFSLTDSVTAKAALIAAISDVFSLTDTASAIAQLKSVLSDTFNLSDEITTALIGNLVDTLTLTDSITNIGHFLIALADTLTITDASSGIIHFQVTLSDTLSLSDQISSLAAYAATIIDTLNLTDEIADITITITGRLTVTFTSRKPTMVFTPRKPTITLS